VSAAQGLGDDKRSAAHLICGPIAACNHPGLVASKLTPDALPAPAPAQSKEQDSDDDDADELADLLAGMAVERKCGRCQDVLESRTATHCDACEIMVQREKERGIDWDADGKGSTKVRMLLTILDKIKRDEKRKGEKTIVFSQVSVLPGVTLPRHSADAMHPRSSRPSSTSSSRS